MVCYKNTLMKIIFYSLLACLLIVSKYVHAAEADTYNLIKEKYARGKHIRILLVPGHDDRFSGAEINGRTEASMNLEMSEVLSSYLSQDKQLEVTLSRDSNGYNRNLLEYINNHKEQIWTDMLSKKAFTTSSIEKGELTLTEQVPHVTAVDDVALILYGINAWSTSEHFDLIVHIHFNDYGFRYNDKKPKYSGFSIYTPSHELLNATTSSYLAEAIGKRMKLTFIPSNQPSEESIMTSNGVIPDFYLIAMGAHKTADTPRVLVEYSYIYEDHLKENLFTISAQTFARATTYGIHDFLLDTKNTQQKNLEYLWENNLVPSKTPSQDVLALQYALGELGFFPSKKIQQGECPFTGVYGACTKKALMLFQKKKRLTQTKYFNTQTRKVFNKLFQDN